MTDQLAVPQGGPHPLGKLEKDLEKVLKDKQQREKVTSLVVSYFRAHKGPLPSPDDLEKYERVLPGLAERIVTMAETQGAHRMKLEDRAITSQLKESSRGQVIGFVLALGCIGLAGYLALNGHDVVAGILGGTTVIGLVTVFVLGRKEQKQELSGKKN